MKKLREEVAKRNQQTSTASPPAKPAATKPATPAAPEPAPGTSCGGNLSAGSKTSCAFALNVESAYYYAGGGNNRIEVYSPVTGSYYAMTCAAGVPTVCRGGNNAVVYIR